MLRLRDLLLHWNLDVACNPSPAALLCALVLSAGGGCARASTPGRPTPSEDERKQIVEAIGVIKGERLGLGLKLEKALKTDRILVAAMGGRGDHGGSTQREKDQSGKTDPLKSSITIDRTKNFSKSPDFACTTEFVDLMDVLLHEAIHMDQNEAQPNPALPPELGKIVERSKREIEAYSEDLAFKKAFHAAMTDIDAGRPVAEHWRRFVKCDKSTRDLMQSRAGQHIVFKNDNITLTKIFVNDPLKYWPELQKEAVPDAFNEMGRGLSQIEGDRGILIDPLSSELFLFTRGSSVVQSLETGIPRPAGAVLLRRGTVLLVTGTVGVSDMGSMRGILRIFTDMDGDGFYDVGATLVDANQFLQAPRAFAIAPDGMPHVYDVARAKLFRILDTDQDGVPDTVDPESRIIGPSNLAQLMKADSINDFAWIEGVPVAFHSLPVSAYAIDPSTRVVTFQDADNDGVLEFVDIKDPIETGLRPPTASIPWFIGQRAIPIFGSSSHGVQIFRVDRSGKEVLLGAGVVQADHLVTVQLSEEIRDRFVYRMLDLQQGAFTDGTHVPLRLFVKELDRAIVPLGGGVIIRATGFGLDKIIRVFVGKVEATISEQREGELRFIAPPQKSQGNKETTFIARDGFVENGPDLLCASDEPEKLVFVQSPSLKGILGARGLVTVQAHVGDASGRALANERVVLQRSDTKEIVGTELSDANGGVSFTVDLDERATNMFDVFADQPPFNGTLDDGDPETGILFPGFTVVAAPISRGRSETLDPSRDTFETFFSRGRVPPDITKMTVEREGEAVRITTEFVNLVVNTSDLANPNVVVGFIDLDTDQNPGTGVFPFTDIFRSSQPGRTGMGTDFFVFLFSTGDGTAEVFSASFGFVGSVPIAFENNRFILSIPLRMLGNDDGNLDYASVLGTIPEPTDIVPNDGHGTLALGRAIRTVGDVVAVLPLVQQELALALPSHQINPVSSKIDAALDSIRKSHLVPAIGQLNAAILEINAISGKIIQRQFIDPNRLAPSLTQLVASRDVLIAAERSGSSPSLEIRKPADNPFSLWGPPR